MSQRSLDETAALIVEENQIKYTDWLLYAQRTSGEKKKKEMLGSIK